MILPKLPKDESLRLDAVNSYGILDTLPEQDYDNITELVASICDIPIALITTLDENRNFFKSHYGIPFNESPRDISFCGHAILDDDILIVKDARLDERFKDNPLVAEQNAIFYAGVPLISPEGFKIGTICAFDYKPRELNLSQIKTLKTLGRQVVKLLELRRNNIKLKNAKETLETRNEQLKRFASHVSHDLKSPLSNIMSLTELIKDDEGHTLSNDSLNYLKSIEDSATILKEYIDGMLRHYKSEKLIESTKENINLSELCEELKQLLITENDELLYDEKNIVNINKPVISQILLNLVDNALNYNDKPKRVIKINYESLDKHHKFTVSDNGIGIAQNEQERVFEIFRSINSDDNKSSTGIGLSTVKNLVEKLGGYISVSSALGKGSHFSFTIAK